MPLSFVYGRLLPPSLTRRSLALFYSTAPIAASSPSTPIPAPWLHVLAKTSPTQQPTTALLHMQFTVTDGDSGSGSASLAATVRGGGMCVRIRRGKGAEREGAHADAVAQAFCNNSLLALHS